MYKIPLDKLGGLLAEIAKDKTLYVPLVRGEVSDFGEWTPDAPVCLDCLNTSRSIKDFFLPQTENLVSFKREGKKVSIIPRKGAPAPFVVFAARACDVRSLDILDEVYLSDPVDTFYKAQRESGVIISMACADPFETCFCGVFNIDASEPQGDVVVRVAGEVMYWEAKTPAGETLTKTVKAHLSEADSGDKTKTEEHKKAFKAAMEKMPLADLNLDGWGSDELLEKFGSDKWAKLSQSCLGCGTCTYACPTCQCYDIRDFDTGHGIERFRCWDSCMFSDFTLMAHGNPRKTQLERFRQRFMHKLVYAPANNKGVYSCVGCGRCLAKCPISMNIVKVIKALGGKR